MSLDLHLFAQRERDGSFEGGTVVRERVVLAALATRVKSLGDAQFGHQVGVELPAEQTCRRLRQVHTHDQRVVAALHELPRDLDGRRAPQGLHVLQPGAAHALLVPCAHVREVDVAEHDPRDVARPEPIEDVEKHGLKAVRVGMRGDQLEPQRAGLRRDEFMAHAVKPHPAGGAFVDVDEVGHVQSPPPRAVECQRGVLATAAHEGVGHGGRYYDNPQGGRGRRGRDGRGNSSARRPSPRVSLKTMPSASLPHLALVRVAPEVTTKARRTRRRFQARLVRNLKDALRSAGIRHQIDARWSRILVTTDQPAVERIADVFGVSSVSAVDARIPAELQEIVRVGEALYAEQVRGKTFAVRARRAGRFPFGTRDVAVQLGAALNRYAPVDLDAPQVTVGVELRDGEAFLYSGRLEGAGGLPIGVQGRAVCLISGGFDSAVAAWLISKRGVSLDYVFCNLGGEAYERAVVSVAKILADQWSWGERPRIHVVDFADPLAALKSAVQPKYWQVVLKRLMYRVAEQVARDVNGEAIITGESLGQVSSQTLGNLGAIDAVTTLPVFRPLVGLDKNEIIARAERIGTAVLSAKVREYCAILPDKPVTHAKERAAASEEAKLDLALLDRAVAARKVLDLRALTPLDLVAPYLFTETVPADAVVLDCREPHHYRAWHYPGAERRDLAHLAAQYTRLDKSRTYVLYCSFGVQTAHLAELMQRSGYEAYSFKGGVRGLMEYAKARGMRVVTA